MSKKLRVMIQGDLFMNPEVFKEAVIRNIGDLGYELDIRMYKYDYPIEQSELPNISLPSGYGVGWDEIEHEATPNIGEFYGELNSFEDKVTDEDILLVHMAPITENVIKKSPNLKYIGSCRGGARNIDVNAATEIGVPVCNAPGRNAVPTAEFTIGLFMSHIRYIARGHEHMKKGIWKVGAYRQSNAGPQVMGSTAGVIGFGAIGKNVGKILNGFGANVVVYDPYVDEETCKENNVTKVELQELLKTSDFVFLCTVLNDKTKHMIGRKEFEMMKPTCHLINAARGGLVDYSALRDALKDNIIAGAAIDVYDPEPPMKDDELLKLPNITLTPHIAAASTGVLNKSADIVAAELRRYLTNDKLNSCVNSEVLK